jgi:hypothetical protein
MSRSALALAFAVAFVALPRVALAGDPCPIGVSVVNLGLPPWAEPALVERMKGADPFLAALLAHAKTQDCVDLMVKPAEAAKLPLNVVDNPSGDVTVEGVKAKLVDTARAFRCQSAHKDVAYLKLTEGESGAVLYYRGHRRVLLVMPGWATVCVDAAKADKDPAREAVAAWQAVTRKMIKDRHDNP